MIHWLGLVSTTTKMFVYKICPFIPIILNYITRPKFHIAFKQNQTIEFTTDKNILSPIYLCLVITNCSAKELNLNPLNFKINNQPYYSLISHDINFLNLNPVSKSPLKSCNNKIYQFYIDNWDNSEKSISFTPNAKEKIAFPICAYKQASHTLTVINQKSLLFCKKKKISLTMELNGKTYEYGLDRITVFSKIINYLAFDHKQHDLSKNQ